MPQDIKQRKSVQSHAIKQSFFNKPIIKVKKASPKNTDIHKLLI